jgi:outer membrane protein assembly factor BamD
MRKAVVKYIVPVFVSLILFSCGGYNKTLKSADNELKFEKAKEYYAKKKYLQAAGLFESVVPVFRGTEKGEEASYLLAMSYFKNKDYLTAKNYFLSYCRNYPKGKYAEEARFNVGYCYYKDSPDVRLEQTATLKAIEEFALFADLYPQSSRLPEVVELMQEMQEKLAHKAYLNANLYYRMGNYMGNNYLSAIIVATDAIKDFPTSKYKEDLAMIILKSKYEQAQKSVPEKMAERYRDTVDEYYNFMNDFPDSKHKKEAQQILEKSIKHLN